MKKEINIAWIDDDIHILEPVIEPLDRAGYKIKRIFYLEEAREAIKEDGVFDLIILDLLLPDNKADEGSIKYPGKEFLEEIRYEKKLKTPVIIFSVVNRSGILESLKKIGVDDILHKPIRPLELKERVEAVLKKYEII